MQLNLTSLRPGLVSPELPIWIAGAILFLGSVLLVIQLGLDAITHGSAQIKIGSTLIGVTEPDQLPLSEHALADGSYQAWLGRTIGTREPYYPFAVRLRNQLEYSLFNVTTTPSIVIGRGQQLLEVFYIENYCSRDIAALMRTAPDWAQKIRQMQDEVERRGKTFLYVLTPSKVAQYPAYIPAKTPCPAPEFDKTGLIPAWMKLVDQAGIHAADTVAKLWTAHSTYPFALFPQGGTHWNAVASALGTQLVESNLQSLRNDDSLAPFSFTWKMTDRPDGVEADLFLLMNLLWAQPRFPVPHITMTAPPAPAGCKPVKIVIVGGSFMESIGAALSHLPCGVDVVEYSYWSIYHISWTDGVHTIKTVDPVIRDRDLKSADILLYEENEAVVGKSQHGLLLSQWLEDTK